MGSLVSNIAELKTWMAGPRPAMTMNSNPLRVADERQGVAGDDAFLIGRDRIGGQC